MARKMKRFAEGGNATQQARYNRKIADIESDYQKWLKSGRYGNPNIAKAKYEQRMADAADDLAKWTGADRSKTRGAESAAVAALKEARRTQGRSIADRDLGSRINPTPEKPMDLSGIKTDLSSVKTPSVTPTRRAAAAPSRRTTPQASARREEAPRSRGAWYDRPAQPPENKDTRDITVTAPKPQKSTAGDPAWARYRMGQAMTAPLRAFAKYNPLSLAARAIFDGEPTAPARAAAPPSAAARSFTPAQQAKLEQLRQAAEAPGASKLAKDRYRTAKETGMVQGLKKGGTAKAKPMMKKPVKKYAKGGSIDGCAVRGKTKAKRTK